jgi:hypothetical protein
MIFTVATIWAFGHRRVVREGGDGHRLVDKVDRIDGGGADPDQAGGNRFDIAAPGAGRGEPQPHPGAEARDLRGRGVFIGVPRLKPRGGDFGNAGRAQDRDVGR